VPRLDQSPLWIVLPASLLFPFLQGCSLFQMTPIGPATVSISAKPASIAAGGSSSLTVTVTNATQVTVAGSDGSKYSLPTYGGTQSVSPKATTTYTATAVGSNGTVTASTTVSVGTAGGGGGGAGNVAAVDHVIFMLQENHSFDNYFGMLNPYRAANGWGVGDDGKEYAVDGIDDKLNSISNEDDQGASFPLFKFTSTCVDDLSSDWLASFGDVNRYDFSTARSINMDGFVHNAQGYAASCSAPGGGGSCAGAFTDATGQRAMGYYDETFLNYYYYMASQFALSDRWFSPVASKSIANRVATFTGGTTQGLVKDPGGDDKLSQLDLPNIFQELDQANVSWKIYYTVTQGFCLDQGDCKASASAAYPATDFSNLTYSYMYLYENPTGAACAAPTQSSSAVGDTSNSFCIDPTHIAPLSQYFTDLKNNTLPSFAFIEAGYGNNDEHPGSGQSILAGQAQVANVVNALMTSPSWADSVFFFSYDEGGGPYDHVPPVPGYSNVNTDASLGTLPDISKIAVNPDSYNPCVPPDGSPTTHCDLSPTDPGANPNDAAAQKGFAAQLGFRLPNIVISPFTRKHYVSHMPMDHTAVIKFVESRFIGASAHLTARDAAQPDLLDFFDFKNIPWATPPTPPTPVSAQSLGYDPCTPSKFVP
jgi:phospholipase C